MEEADLWRVWRESQDGVARQRLLALHLPYARTVAAMLYAQRTHNGVDFEDYLQWANVGLMEALVRFEPDHGAQFRSFAAKRIRGAVLDGLAVMTEHQQQVDCLRRLRAQRVVQPDESGGKDAFARLAEVAMGLAIGFMLEGTAMVHPQEELTGFEGRATGGYEAQELRHLRRRVNELVRALPAGQRNVIERHYLHAQAFDAIATEMDLSKGRIAQLHRQGLSSLRKQLVCAKTGDRHL